MPVAEGTPQTLYDKVLQAHVVDEKLDGTILLYIGKFCVMLFPPLRTIWILDLRGEKERMSFANIETQCRQTSRA